MFAYVVWVLVRVVADRCVQIDGCRGEEGTGPNGLYVPHPTFYLYDSSAPYLL